MLQLKSLAVTLLLSVAVNAAICQSTNNNDDDNDKDDDKDTTTQVVQLNKITPRKKGVYKSYKEFLEDAPSRDVEFTVTPLKISKNNPLVAEADIDYKGKRPKNVWGVSDGENVYVRVALGQFFKNHYFKIQCDGPKPYVFLVENPVFLPLGAGVIVAAGVAAGSAALPPFVSLMVVRDETNYMKPLLLATNARVKRMLAEYPDLLEAYKNEPDHKKSTRAKYLTSYNLRKIQEAVK